MGKGAGTCAINIGGKDTQFRSGEAQHVGISPQEDRVGAAGTLGEVKGESTEEGGLGDGFKLEPAAKVVGSRIDFQAVVPLLNSLGRNKSISASVKVISSNLFKASCALL